MRFIEDFDKFVYLEDGEILAQGGKEDVEEFQEFLINKESSNLGEILDGEDPEEADGEDFMEASEIDMEDVRRGVTLGVLRLGGRGLGGVRRRVLRGRLDGGGPGAVAARLERVLQHQLQKHHSAEHQTGELPRCGDQAPEKEGVHRFHKVRFDGNEDPVLVHLQKPLAFVEPCFADHRCFNSVLRNLRFCQLAGGESEEAQEFVFPGQDADILGLPGDYLPLVRVHYVLNLHIPAIEVFAQNHSKFRF